MEDEGQEELFMKHLFTMLLTLVAVTASAQDFEVDGIYYNILSEDDKTVEVTGSPYGYSGDVVIPAEVTYDGSTYSVTMIGDNAFNLCSALTSVEMPAVETIGEYAFGWCSDLTSVEMPAVTTIGEYAFGWCEALTSVEMPAVTAIGEYAFGGCSALAYIHLPASCTSVFSNPFIACKSLREITVDENNPDYTSVDGVLYDKNVETLLACPGSKSFIDIPSSVTTIGDEAFSDCSALTSVSMPEVTTIGREAFSFCSALTSVEMPTVTAIGEYAFGGCSALAYIHLPASCTSVFSNPFIACKSLREITVDENNPDYTSVDGVLYDKNVETLLACPGSKSFIDIPSSVTTIGEDAFGECSALTSVEMPAVTTIGVGAFDGCSALTSVDIPASVTMIGNYAFNNCDALTAVYCHWDEPLECEPKFEDEIFMNATLYVPTGTVDAYRSVSPWDKFINIEEKDYSGIADTPQSEVTVKVIDGAITVEGGDGTASAPVVEVYSAGGLCIYRGTDSSIGGLTHGVYVVKVDGTVQKVAL